VFWNVENFLDFGYQVNLVFVGGGGREEKLIFLIVSRCLCGLLNGNIGTSRLLLFFSSFFSYLANGPFLDQWLRKAKNLVLFTQICFF
jgi:hypothetical protein